MTKKGSWVIIGRHTVLEALDDGQTIDKVMLDRLASFPDVVEKCKIHEVPIQKVPREKLDKYGTNHQGVAAFRSQVEYTSLEDLVPHLFETGAVPVLMILDRVTDVGNFGSISRSAEVLGADGLIFPVRESAQINADAVKRSSGALLRIPLCRVRDLVTAARFLKDSGFTVIAADQNHSGAPLPECNLQYRQQAHNDEYGQWKDGAQGNNRYFRHCGLVRGRYPGLSRSRRIPGPAPGFDPRNEYR